MHKEKGHTWKHNFAFASAFTTCEQGIRSRRSVANTWDLQGNSDTNTKFLDLLLISTLFCGVDSPEIPTSIATACKLSCGKVMFSVMCVCLSFCRFTGGEWGLPIWPHMDLFFFPTWSWFPSPTTCRPLRMQPSWEAGRWPSTGVLWTFKQ